MARESSCPNTCSTAWSRMCHTVCPLAQLKELCGEPSACLARFTRLCNVPSSSSVCPVSCSPCFVVSHDSIDMKITSSAKWHVSVVLHTSSFRHCCILGLLPCSVKSLRPRFQALCSSSFSSLSSQGGGTSSIRGELSLLTASSGIKSRCDP